jgi:hypothetical protein
MMNQQEILKKIGQILQDLTNQHQYLTDAAQINDLEIKLLSAHADFLVDHIEILRKLAAHQEVDLLDKLNESTNETFAKEDDEAEETLLPNEVLDEPKTTVFHFSLDDEPEEMVFDFEKELNVEEVFDRPLSDEEIEILKDKVPIYQNLTSEIQEEEQQEDVQEEIGPEPFLITIEEPISEIEVAKIIIEDVEVKEDLAVKMTLNELLSSQLETRNSSSDFTKKAADDLKSAISLNDKMLFIKSLFNGYNLAYSEAIEILNRFDSFEAADNFLIKNYAQKNTWGEKQEVVDRFYEYLNRKFIS